jgi:hypothetical protein
MGLTIAQKRRSNCVMAKLWDMIQKTETLAAKPKAKSSPVNIEADSLVQSIAKPKRGRPRIEDKGKTLTATQPWKALGMSRRTWEKRRKENDRL